VAEELGTGEVPVPVGMYLHRLELREMLQELLVTDLVLQPGDPAARAISRARARKQTIT